MLSRQKENPAVASADFKPKLRFKFKFSGVKKHYLIKNTTSKEANDLNYTLSLYLLCFSHKNQSVPALI